MRVPVQPAASNALQVLFVVAVGAVLAVMASTAHDNLVRQGIATGFDFLSARTGWDVSASFLPQSPADPYWWTFLVGLSNTLALSVVCIVLATLAGLLLALVGAGKSRIPYALTRGYVWLFRNVPLIVQVFFWYHITRQFPPVRQAEELLGCCYASNRGVYVPHVGLDATLYTFAAVGIAAVVAYVLIAWVDRQRRAPGRFSLRGPARWALVAGAALLAAVLTIRLDVTTPKLQGFNFVGGTYVSPEFMALVVAIVAYNTAFVAEIINSGIRSVPLSQREAARIIGLSDPRTFWRIIVPQAIRVAVPPLINQYISLTKSTSLAIAIGYTDLFSVGVIAINHTGQSLNIIAVLMAIYLVVSLGISALGNAYNRSIAARGRR